MKPDKFFRKLPIFLIGTWLGVFVLIPLILMLIISFLNHSSNQLIIWQFTLSNYKQLFTDLFFIILWHSLVFALIATTITLLIGYPAAYFLASLKSHYKPILLLLIIIPFWTSSLIRTYAILTIIKTQGLLNSTLLALGIIHHPLQLLYTNTAVFIGVVYNLLPFMILPLYTNIEKLDRRLYDAARDLGASKLRIFRRITIPLTFPGIITGVLFVFLPAMTLFYIPDLLGGAKSLLLGNLVEAQFLSFSDWPGGAATSIFLTCLMLLLLWVYRRTSRQPNSPELL